jgi:hypothetical protein
MKRVTCECVIFEMICVAYGMRRVTYEMKRLVYEVKDVMNESSHAACGKRSCHVKL